MPCESHAKTMRKPCENHAKHQGRTEKKEQGKIWRIIARKASGHTSQFRHAKAMRKPCENHAKISGHQGEKEREKETPLLVDGGCLPTTVLPPMSMGVAGLHETPVLVHMRNSKRRAWQAFEGSRTPIAGLVNKKCNIMQGFPSEALLILILAAVW